MVSLRLPPNVVVADAEVLNGPAGTRGLGVAEGYVGVYRFQGLGTMENQMGKKVQSETAIGDYVEVSKGLVLLMSYFLKMHI